VNVPDGPDQGAPRGADQLDQGGRDLQRLRGPGPLRCTNCHGKKETRWDCAACKGTGKKRDELGYELPCYPCRGRGYDKLLKCEKCKDGFYDCKQCDKKPRKAPEMDEICTGVRLRAVRRPRLRLPQRPLGLQVLPGPGPEARPKSRPGQVLQ
jgi:hypothetical protein